MTLKSTHEEIQLPLPSSISLGTSRNILTIISSRCCNWILSGWNWKPHATHEWTFHSVAVSSSRSVATPSFNLVHGMSRHHGNDTTSIGEPFFINNNSSSFKTFFETKSGQRIS